jgi:hypothetical protein
MSIRHTAVTDDGLPALYSLTKLNDLLLNKTAVSGPGVRKLLDKMPSLRHINIDETSVSSQDFVEMIQDYPRVKIFNGVIPNPNE